MVTRIVTMDRVSPAFHQFCSEDRNRNGRYGFFSPLSFYRLLIAGDPATAIRGVNSSLFYFLRSTDPLCITGLLQKYISSIVPCSFKEIKPLLSYTAPCESAAKIQKQTKFLLKHSENSLLTTPCAKRAIWKFSLCHWPDLPPCTVRGFFLPGNLSSSTSLELLT